MRSLLSVSSRQQWIGTPQHTAWQAKNNHDKTMPPQSPSFLHNATGQMMHFRQVNREPWLKALSGSQAVTTINDANPWQPIRSCREQPVRAAKSKNGTADKVEKPRGNLFSQRALDSEVQRTAGDVITKRREMIGVQFALWINVVKQEKKLHQRRTNPAWKMNDANN